MTVSTPNHAQQLGFPSVLKVPCPTCNAPVSEPCRPGSILIPHVDRVLVARAVKGVAA